MAYTRDEYDDERIKGELPGQSLPSDVRFVPLRHSKTCTCGQCRPAGGPQPPRSLFADPGAFHQGPSVPPSAACDVQPEQGRGARGKYIRDFESGKLRALINSNMLTKGFDRVQSDADRLREEVEHLRRLVIRVNDEGCTCDRHPDEDCDNCRDVRAVRAGVQPDAPPAESVQQEPDADPPEWTAFMQHIGSCQQCQDNARPLCARGRLLQERYAGVPTVPAPVTGDET